MTYNLHPILVHFPIALLLVYSVIKLLPLKIWLPNVAWRDIERVVLIVGVLGAFTALLTGDTAEHLFQPNRQLVNAHSSFATLATWIYGALLLGEIAAIVNTYGARLGQKYTAFLKGTAFLEKLLCDKILSSTLALLGLIAITLTGLLGGVMVYGVSADPIAPTILKLLGISI